MSGNCAPALARARAGERLFPAQALALAREATDSDLLGCADAMRARLHTDGVVTYVVDRNVNYSNVCTSVCNFCNFYVAPRERGGYLLSYDEICAKVEETLRLGGSGMLMQGGVHPDLPLSWYTGLFQLLKRRYPEFYLHCLSPTEVFGLARTAGLDLATVLTELKAAGLDSIPGGGGEILVDGFRQKRRSLCSSEEWLETCRQAHQLSIPTTATMMFGMGEDDAMRVEHLDRLRALQDETGGFIAFIPWTFQPDGTPLGRMIRTRVPVDEYLRWLALSRLYLDNIANVQVSWLTQGLDGGKRGLRAGANDIGSIMIEENVISKAGAHHQANEQMLRTAIVEAGFRPKLRNAGYRRLPERAAGARPAAPLGTGA